MDKFTIEGVAARSGVSKMTIYKWWPTKGALALDGYATFAEPRIAFQDTGDVRADLIAEVEALIRLLTDTPAGVVIAGLVGAAQTDPILAQEMRNRYFLPRRRMGIDALRRGQDRGELRDELDLEVVIDQIYGAIYNRLLTGVLPIDMTMATRLVDNIFLGIARPAPTL
jgi:AcrR family transcriptional regulator